MNSAGRRILSEGWQKDETASGNVTNPYLDWWHFIRPEGVETDDGSGNSYRVSPDVRLVPGSGRKDGRGSGGENGALAGDGTIRPGRAHPPRFEEFFPACKIPVPERAWNAGFNPEDPWIPDGFQVQDWILGGTKPETLDQNAVIVGVIDRGIPLGHRRLRDRNGKSRILAAWLQTAPPRDRDPSTAAASSIITDGFLPFGRELSKREIDELLENNTIGDLHTGTLREEEFNRACGTLDLGDRLGPRELAGRVAHGAHVLDAAAGFDPHRGAYGATTADRIWAMTVTLPDRASVGLSGTFLEFYVLYAIYRIVHLADALWDDLFADGKEARGRKGFPIAINLSFGKQAGRKDGRDLLDKLVEKLNHKREAEGRPPLVLIIPAGNENLLRCNAFMSLAPRAAAAGSRGDPAAREDQGASAAKTAEPHMGRIELQVRPEDHSSNYVEIRSEWIDKNKIAGDDPFPLHIKINPPALQLAQPAAIYNGDVFQLGNFARLYAERAEEYGKCRFSYLICLAPSINQFCRNDRVPDEESPFRTAPAGRWTITLENRSGTRIRTLLSVQTDQSVHPAGATGLRAYFIDKSYEATRFDRTTGRPVDSYTYGSGTPISLDTSAGVRRHGTISATALARGKTFVVAGYRRSDGRPSPFSATRMDKELLIVSPEKFVALPAEDDAALFGVLAAGAADGSVVAMRGTSFSSALCTRAIALLLAEDPELDLLDALGRLEGGLPDAHGNGLPWPDASKNKVGEHRAEIELDRKVTRRNGEPWQPLQILEPAGPTS